VRKFESISESETSIRSPKSRDSSANDDGLKARDNRQRQHSRKQPQHMPVRTLKKKTLASLFLVPSSPGFVHAIGVGGQCKVKGQKLVPHPAGTVNRVLNTDELARGSLFESENLNPRNYLLELRAVLVQFDDRIANDTSPGGVALSVMTEKLSCIAFLPRPPREAYDVGWTPCTLKSMTIPRHRKRHLTRTHK
jgi:hypothetical protein